jgi:hypothetical protein
MSRPTTIFSESDFDAKIYKVKETAENHIQSLSIHGATSDISEDEKDLIRDSGMETYKFLKTLEVELKRHFHDDPSELHNFLKTSLDKLESEYAKIDSIFSIARFNAIKRQYVKIKIHYVNELLKLFPAPPPRAKSAIKPFGPYKQLGGRKRTGRRRSGKKRTVGKKRKSTTRRK